MIFLKIIQLIVGIKKSSYKNTLMYLIEIFWLFAG
jgi:hypothetical protein